MGRWAIDRKSIEEIERLKISLGQSQEHIRDEIKKVSGTILNLEEGLGVYASIILEECSRVYEYTIQCEETLENLQSSLTRQQEFVERMLK